MNLNQCTSCLWLHGKHTPACPADEAERDAETRAAVESEIVAWLRANTEPGCRDAFCKKWHDLADAIERGEHRAKK